MTWSLVKGHKGPVKGLRASGPQGLDPLFTRTHYSTSELVLDDSEYCGSSDVCACVDTV
jgi:hypothetical protein